jgi:O-antigen/teichoic acid export membrane protein
MKFALYENLINHKKIFAEGSWVVSGQFINAIIQLIGIRIVTEFLPADLLGVATMWLGIVVLLKSVFIQPFLNYQLRFYPEHQINKTLIAFKKFTFKTTLIIFLCSSILFVIVALIVIQYGSSLHEYLILLILILYYFFDLLKSFFINQLSAERKQKQIALWSIFEITSSYLFIYFILSYHSTVENYITAMGIGTLSGIILFNGTIVSKTKEPSASELSSTLLIKNALKFSAPFIPIAILSWIMNLSSRYFIGFINDAYEAGLFVAAFSISSRPFNMLSGVITGLFRPILFHAYSQGDNQKVDLIKKYWFFAISVLGTATILIIFFGRDFIANTLLAREYRENSSKLFLFIGLGYFGLTMFQAFENFLFAEKRIKDILYANVIGTSIFVTSSYFLVSELSSFGAAIAVAISFSVQAFTAFYLYRYR